MNFGKIGKNMEKKSKETGEAYTVECKLYF